MHCASCASNIQRMLKKLPGVTDASVNFASEKATVEFDPSQVSVDQMNEKIKPLGYQLETPAPMTMPADMPGMDHSMHGEHANHGGVPTVDKLEKSRNAAAFAMPLALLVFAGMLWEIGATYFSFLPPLPLPMVMWQIVMFLLATAVLFSVGKPFATALIPFVTMGKANMDTLIGMGTMTAYLYSTFVLAFPTAAARMGLPETLYFDVTVVVIGFIVYGKFLEARSKAKTGEALSKLLQLQAKTAIMRKNGQDVEVPISEVKVGDILVVRPGGKLAVDGEVIEGASAVDESMVTGEPMPVDKEAGNKVIGGTINQQGVLVYKATKVGGDTLLAQIAQMVESAQGSKAPIERMADQISAVFVPTVIAIAVATFIMWTLAGGRLMPFTEALSLALTAFVGILVIACPCALGLATPTAMIVAVGKGASAGILIKDAESLEKLHKVKAVVMDKTGTLTYGRPEVTDVRPAEGVKAEELMETLASLEQNSEHPLARAILAYAEFMEVAAKPVTHFAAVAGKGLTGKLGDETYFAGNATYMQELKVDFDLGDVSIETKKGKTPVFLAAKKKLLGIVYVADKIKDEAKSTVAALHKMGIKVVMLTGDDENTARHIADQLGIDEVIAKVLPGEKATQVERIKKEHGVTTMVGDGVNDAPALATADVGIAMSTGTDVAISTANLTLLSGDIGKILSALRLSRKTMRTVKQNLFWAFAYNIVLIPVAAGILYPLYKVMLNPALAAGAMAISSVSVVSNSLLLKRAKI